MTARRTGACLLLATACVVLAGVLAACDTAGPAGPGPGSRSAGGGRTAGPAQPTPAAAQAPPGARIPPGRLVGFSVSGYPPGQAALERAETATGVHANVVSWYTGLGQPFNPGYAAQVASTGALPVVEIDSDTHPLTEITSGAWDEFLTSYARAVAAYRGPVAIDFDHEFNGDWSTWGPHLNTAATFVEAWRRVVTIFRRNGTDNVIWVWNPNVNAPTVADMRPWYPGDQYVTWAGIDGYFFSPGDTYASVFPATLSELATVTKKPVLIVETGASPGSWRPGQITSLFAGLAAEPNVIGVIWFDYDKGPGDDWQLEGDRASIAAFRAGATAFVKHSAEAGSG